MDNASDKRRRDERTALEHDVRLIFIRPCDTAMTGKVTAIGKIINQSKLGFCILTSFYIEKGDLLKPLTSLHEESEYYFDVRWVYPIGKDYMFGCSITNMP
jgi:hypothetical protein